MEYDIVPCSESLKESVNNYLLDSFISAYVIGQLRRSSLPPFIRNIPHRVFCNYYRDIFQEYLCKSKIYTAVIPDVEDVFLGVAAGYDQTLVWVSVKHTYRQDNNIGSGLVKSVVDVSKQVVTPFCTRAGRELLANLK